MKLLIRPELLRKHHEAVRRLTEAKTTVKGHVRHSKKGKAFNVKSYQREISWSKIDKRTWAGSVGGSHPYRIYQDHAGKFFLSTVHGGDVGNTSFNSLNDAKNAAEKHNVKRKPFDVRKALSRTMGKLMRKDKEGNSFDDSEQN